MAMGKILVAYASKGGATQEAAKKSLMSYAQNLGKTLTSLT
jgi:hypothetical protein